MRRLLVATATAILFAVVAAPPAFAAPSVTSSDPADGAEEHEAPETVTITFDQPLDPETALIKVVDGCGRQIDAENTTVQLNEMSVDLAKKPSGLYKAFYYAEAPAGVTGSASGSISFTVHFGPACGPDAEKHNHGGSEGNHEGHEGEGHESGTDHEGHDGGSGHSTHSTSTHTTHNSTGHSTHTTASGSGHSDHQQATGNHHHKNKGNGPNINAAGGKDPAPRAAGNDPIGLSDGQAVLVSLAACLLLGVGGGWMIRTTQAPRRRTA